MRRSLRLQSCPARLCDAEGSPRHRRTCMFTTCISRGLWDGLGGMGINPLLLYFVQDDFDGIDDFGRWLKEVKNSGWLTHIFRGNITR